MSTKMVATRNETSDLLRPKVSSVKIYINRSKPKSTTTFSTTKKTNQLILTTQASNILPPFWSKVMKLKFLSRCHHQSWITVSSSWISFFSFVRQVIPINFIFAVRTSPLLKKKTIKRNMTFSLEIDVFPRYTTTTRANSNQSSYEPTGCAW